MESIAIKAIKAREKFLLMYAEDQVKPYQYEIRGRYNETYLVMLQSVDRLYESDLKYLTIADIDVAFECRIRSSTLATSSAMEETMSMLEEFVVKIAAITKHKLKPTDELLFNKYIKFKMTMMRAAQQAALHRMKVRDEISTSAAAHPYLKVIADMDRRAEVAMKAAIGLAEQRRKREKEEDEQKKKKEVEESMTAEHLQRNVPIVGADIDPLISALMQHISLQE